MSISGLVSCQRPMRPGTLKRTVLLADRSTVFHRVIPVPMLIAMDEPGLILDAHLCYGTTAGVRTEDMAGFFARACAYAACLVSPEKQSFIYDNVMSLEEIMRYNDNIPISSFEWDRAELFDAIQGGNRLSLLGKKIVVDVKEATRSVLL